MHIGLQEGKPMNRLIVLPENFCTFYTNFDSVMIIYTNEFINS
jgi:predicted amidohydrolase